MDNLSDELIDSIFEEVGIDNKTIDQLFKKIYKSLKRVVKSEDDDLLFSNNPRSPLIRKLIRKYYTEEQLRTAVYNNTKRVPGNLSKEDKMMQMYDTLELFDYQCPYSGTLLMGGEEKIHLDHIIPVNLGGPTDDWNCLPICGSCNISKSDRHLLDWWDEKHSEVDEYRLVKIYEYMISKLSHKNDVKFITSLTDEQINQNSVIDKNESISRLDVFTFLFQLKQHIEENRNFIFHPGTQFESVEDKEAAINNKLTQLNENLIELFESNKKRKNVQTDIELLNQQKDLILYLKKLNIYEHYRLANTFFEELILMISQGVSDEDIVEFCNINSHGFEYKVQVLKAWLNQHPDKSLADIELADIYEDAEDERYSGEKIGSFISGFRKQYNKRNDVNKNKKLKPLNDEQVKCLEEMGMIWVKFSDKEKIDLLIEWYNDPENRKNNKTLKDIKQNDVYKGVEIGVIISVLRQKHNIKLGIDSRRKELSDEHTRILEDMGMVWDALSFDVKTDILVKWYNDPINRQRNRTLKDVKRRDVYKDVQIGRLLIRLREKREKGLLDDEQIRFLDSMGMIWSDEEKRMERFLKRIQYLTLWYEEHKDKGLDLSNIKKNDVYQGKAIGKTIANLRRDYKARDWTEEECKEGKATPLLDEEVRILERMGIVWHKNISKNWTGNEDSVMAI